MSRRAPGDAGSVAAAAVAVAALAVSWSGLHRGVGAGRVLLLCLLAALPALAALAPRRRTAAVALALLVAVPSVLALATRASLADVATLDGPAWSTIASVVPDGLAAGSRTGLPVSPADQPALVGLLDLALALLAGAAAWQIAVRRRPVVGLVVVGAGLAYRWTVLPPGSGVLAGAAALAALAAVLALSGREPDTPVRAGRHLMGALVLGGVAVVVAAGLGAGPARAGDPWWAWKQWEVGVGGPGDGSSGGGLDLRQRYGKLDWPTTPRVVVTVATDRARPLRALSLGDFDGVAFTLADGGGSEALPVSRGAIVVGGADPDRRARDAGRHGGRRELAGAARLGPAGAGHRPLLGDRRPGRRRHPPREPAETGRPLRGPHPRSAADPLAARAPAGLRPGHRARRGAPACGRASTGRSWTRRSGAPAGRRRATCPSARTPRCATWRAAWRGTRRRPTRPSTASRRTCARSTSTTRIRRSRQACPPTGPPACRPTTRRWSTSSCTAAAASASTSPGRWP